MRRRRFSSESHKLRRGDYHGLAFSLDAFNHRRSRGKGDIVFATLLGDIWQHRTIPIDPLRMISDFKHTPNPVMGVHQLYFLLSPRSFFWKNLAVMSNASLDSGRSTSQ